MDNNEYKIQLIYINFAPYQNTGNILHYLQDTYHDIAVFTFNFHHLGPNQKPSSLVIYHNSVIKSQKSLFHTPTTESLAFALLPLRSFIIFLQIIYHTYYIYKRSGQIETFFTVNAFIAWTGNILRRLNLVKHTIYWVWDYYPPHHDKLMVRFIRFLYWIFDTSASINADKTIYINNRLINLRKSIHVIKSNVDHVVVPIGTQPTQIKKRNNETIKLVFFGVLKKSEGLDVIIDNSNELIKIYPNIELHIIGGGPDESYFVTKASKSNMKIKFHGYIPDDDDVDSILSTCTIGLAPYLPDPSNVSYYTDPSKIKKYLSLNLPVITTNVFEFSKQIEIHHAGIIFHYHQKISFVHAVETIMKSYRSYQNNCHTLAKTLEFNTLYLKIFD
jgi:glycosyltransferase involved in cell wall biosynthesis